MKWFARNKRKWLLVVCNLFAVCFLIAFSGCIAGADYENKMIYVYRSTGPKVLEQFKVPRSKEISPRKLQRLPTRSCSESLTLKSNERTARLCIHLCTDHSCGS